MKIALCGNPNVGKTTLFNKLTRSDEPVGNWHGVTVGVREKRMENGVYLSDLPGAYSLTPRTAEERITRDSIINGDYDAVIYVAEANNLRRNLYMFMQLVEAGKKVALAVNMMDEARCGIDIKLLADRLGVPVIGTSYRTVTKREIREIAGKARTANPPSYLSDPRVKAVSDKVRRSEHPNADRAFLALKTMECDEDVVAVTGGCRGDCKSCSVTDRDLPARLRYDHIDNILNGVISRGSRKDRTPAIDRVVLGKLALPIFFVVMTAVFAITFEAGRPLSDLLTKLVNMATAAVGKIEMQPVFSSLICDGVISGIGSTLAFLPQVVLMFLLTAILQDSGYMSRVAFITDDFFKKFGLSGRAAFSVVLGLGCSATAVLATRGIAGERRRSRAAFAAPFCPCSARLAVFTAICAYFGLSGLYVAAMYVIGFAVMLAVLKIMSVIHGSRGEENELIMEIPPYRVPRAGRVISVVLHNISSFVLRIGSVVLAVSVVMWALCNFSVADGFILGGGETSIMSTFAGLISPIFAPLGFGNWRAVTALISGIAAKETVISVIVSLGGYDTVFGNGIHAAVSFMIFTCLYVPCVATVSALAKENGAKSAALSVFVHTVTAYIVSLVYYQAACLFEHDRTAFWITLAAVASVVAATAFTIAILARIKRGRRKNKILSRQNYGKETRTQK